MRPHHHDFIMIIRLNAKQQTANIGIDKRVGLTNSRKKVNSANAMYDALFTVTPFNLSYTWQKKTNKKKTNKNLHRAINVNLSVRFWLPTERS